MRGMNARAVVALATLALAGAGWALRDRPTVGGVQSDAPQHQRVHDDVRALYESHSRGREVRVDGTVERILADDRDGSPHQRFIVRSPSDLSLLVAHNLDLAPRLEGLAAGDRVTLQGEYVWNERGGLMHWTHHDPQGRHPAGYIEWQGRRYQ
jgi:hypothetical protein